MAEFVREDDPFFEFVGRPKQRAKNSLKPNELDNLNGAMLVLIPGPDRTVFWVFSKRQGLWRSMIENEALPASSSDDDYILSGIKFLGAPEGVREFELFDVSKGTSRRISIS